MRFNFEQVVHLTSETVIEKKITGTETVSNNSLSFLVPLTAKG